LYCGQSHFTICRMIESSKDSAIFLMIVRNARA
jgi:hypothetical protein